MKPRIRIHLAAPVLAGLITFATLGCRAAEPTAAPVKVEELADKAMISEMAARFQDAAELYLKAATELAEATRKAEKDKDDKSANPEASAAAWAEVEFLVEKAYALAERCQFRRLLVEPLKKLEKLAENRPNMLACIRWRMAACLRASGATKPADRELRELGFITDWQVIGPFDNERGQGFGQAYPPETELDLAKNYPGKKRKVAWQRNPRMPEDGYIDLAGMLRPNQQAVAYLLTYVQVSGKKELPAAVRLASDDGVKVWLNGKPVWTREAVREATFDQDCFGVILKPDANALLVKVAQSDGEWGLRVRLTAPDGAPLKDAETRADRTYPAIEAAAGQAPEVELGAIGWFTRHAAAEPKDAGVLMRLGFLSSRLGAFDHDNIERPDRQSLDAAVKLEPANARLWYELSAVAAAGGTMKAETDENPRRRALEQSVKLMPSAAAELELAAHYLRQYRNFGKAALHLDKAKALSPDSTDIRLFEIEMSSERGDEAEAFAAAAALAKARPDSARAQALYAQMLEQAGNNPAAAEAYGATLKLDADEDVMRRLAGVWLKAGQSYKAQEIDEQLLDRRPYHADLCAERAKLAAGRGDYTSAIEECQRGLNICREDHKLLAQLGEYLAATRKPDRAREAWRQALELQPNYAELERYVEYVEGRVSYDRKYRENVAEILAAAPKVGGGANEAGAFLLNKVIDRVYPDGTNSRTTHQIIKVLSNAGAKRFGEDRVVYYADEQRAVIRTARVIHADGREEQAKLGREQVVKVEERNVGVLGIRFPSLVPGDVIEIEHRVDDLEQSFFGRYFGNVFHFRQELPVSVAKYVLIAPAGLELHTRAVRCEAEPVIRQDKDDNATIYTWTMRDQPRIENEPLMPPLSEVSPSVEVSTYKDWGTFGKWYWGLVRKQHEAGPELSRISKELCAGATTEMDKIRAVYNYVVTDVRYVAWEFGVHGFKPYRAEQILTRKFGDCKDKATLICALLAEQGIAAHPVLIRAETLRGKQDLGLPLISSFNHCIAWLPAGKDRPELWLDGTAQYCSIDALLDTDRGARVAVIMPDGAVVKDIPVSAPETNATACDFKLTLEPSGLARGTARVTASGDRSMIYRANIQKQEFRAKQLSRLHGRSHQGAEAVGVTASDFRDLNTPISLKYSLDLPGTARPSGDGFVLDLPEDPLRGVLGYNGRDELFAEHFTSYASGLKREYDVVLPAAWQYTAKYEVSLPESLTVAALPADVKLESEFGKLIITRKLEGNRLTISKTVALSTTRVPVAKYPQFREFCMAVDRAESEKVTLAKKAAAPAVEEK